MKFADLVIGEYEQPDHEKSKVDVTIIGGVTFQ
jgi:hypothetical protein